MLVCYISKSVYVIIQLTLSTLSIHNGIVHAFIWNIPYRSVGVKVLMDYFLF